MHLNLMQMRLLILWSLVSLVAACGDLKVRSVAATQVVPVGLEGRWVGTWQSEFANLSGNVEIRIQEFDGEPLVMLRIDNPCLVPRNYELVLTGKSIELQADGVSVLRADHSVPGQLLGTYACAEDQGSWTAQWLESLPTVLDLSGSWQGRIYAAGQPDQPIVVTLVQRVQDGALMLDGVAELPSVLPVELPLAGYVQFRESAFELVLHSDPGFEPEIIVSGIGDREPLQLPIGLLQVLSPTALPFSQAFIELVRRE